MNWRSGSRRKEKRRNPYFTFKLVFEGWRIVSLLFGSVKKSFLFIVVFMNYDVVKMNSLNSC